MYKATRSVFKKKGYKRTNSTSKKLVSQTPGAIRNRKYRTKKNEVSDTLEIAKGWRDNTREFYSYVYLLQELIKHGRKCLPKAALDAVKMYGHKEGVFGDDYDPTNRDYMLDFPDAIKAVATQTAYASHMHPGTKPKAFYEKIYNDAKAANFWKPKRLPAPEITQEMRDWDEYITRSNKELEEKLAESEKYGALRRELHLREQMASLQRKPYIVTTEEAYFLENYTWRNDEMQGINSEGEIVWKPKEFWYGKFENFTKEQRDELYSTHVLDIERLKRGGLFPCVK